MINFDLTIRVIAILFLIFFFYFIYNVFYKGKKVTQNLKLIGWLISIVMIIVGFFGVYLTITTLGNSTGKTLLILVSSIASLIGGIATLRFIKKGGIKVKK